jgi:exonuclease VII small subunit
MDDKASLSKTHEDASRTLREMSELVSKLQQREFELEKQIQGLKRQVELIKIIYSPEIKN